MRQVIVLKKSNVWYAKSPEYNGWDDRYQINGAPVEKCIDGRWCQLSQQPQKIEVLVTPPSRIVAYKLRDDCREVAPNAAAEVAPEFFALHDDYETRDNEHLYRLYEEVRETPESYLDLCEWDIVLADLDCEPVTMTLPVKVDVPKVFTEYLETHHKYPCTLSSDALFDLLWDRVHAKIGASDNFQMDAYKNIRALTVKRLIKFATPQKASRNVARFGARKPKWQKYLKHYDAKTLFTIHGASYKSSGPYTPTLRANNYAEMEKQVDEYCQGFLDQLEDVAISECPHCQGYGFVEAAK